MEGLGSNDWILLVLAAGRLLHLESIDIEARLWLKTFPGDEDKLERAHKSWGCLAGLRVLGPRRCVVEW